MFTAAALTFTSGATFNANTAALSGGAVHSGGDATFNGANSAFT
ncbi:MAG: hypothetical protein LBT53_07370, partial [Puniceicoccales bacterium]|nr:hypothetical protein [Puniceicoccales bacterium]